MTLPLSSLPFPESPLVSVEALTEWLSDPRLIIVDASIFPINREDEIIPEARSCDIDAEFSDPSTSLPHAMPSAEQFERAARALGINSDSIIVAYDTMGIYSAARAWWMFKAMGHDKVAVLDGGLPAWKEAGLPVASKRLRNENYPPGNFVAHPQEGFFATAEDTLAAAQGSSVAVLDARSATRFQGTSPEPRPGLRAGHIPGSDNVPFESLLENGRMRNTTALRQRLESVMAGRDAMITSCGSGVTACIISLAAELAGYTDIKVYDGSWSEWGARADLPVAAGH